MYINRIKLTGSFIFIFHIFQSTSSLESNLEGLASVLEADLPNYKMKILKILCGWYVIRFFDVHVYICSLVVNVWKVFLIANVHSMLK